MLLKLTCAVRRASVSEKATADMSFRGLASSGNPLLSTPVAASGAGNPNGTAIGTVEPVGEPAMTESSLWLTPPSQQAAEFLLGQPQDSVFHDKRSLADERGPAARQVVLGDLREKEAGRSGTTHPEVDLVHSPFRQPTCIR